MHQNPQVEQIARLAVRVFAVTAGCMAFTAAFSWIFGQWSFMTFGRNFKPTSPLTAWLLVLFSVALLVQARWPQRLAARISAGLTVSVTSLVSLLVLGRAIFGYPLPLETWLAGAPVEAGSISARQMSTISATIFLPAGLALILMIVSSKYRPISRRIAAAAATLVLFISLVITLGYLAGTHLLYTEGQAVISLWTTFIFTILGLGLLINATPDFWLLQMLTGRQRPTPGIKLDRSAWASAIILLVLLITIVSGGLYYMRDELNVGRVNAQKELAGIADLKVGQIVHWREDQINKALFLLRAPFVRQDVQAFLSKLGVPTQQTELFRWLSALKDTQEFTWVALFDSQGRMRLSIPPRAEAAPSIPTTDAAVLATLSSDSVRMSDLHRNESAGEIHLDISIPVFRPDVSSIMPSAPLAVLLLGIDPTRFLYPLIQSWPTPSRSAETLLVRQDGDHVLFLNDLRHRAKAALNLRLLLNDPQLPAAMALRGTQSVIEGQDYRGVRVLAALRKVSDTPWAMVAKIDQEEVYAPIRERIWSRSILIVTLALFVTIGIGQLWWHRKSELLQQQLVVEQERSALAGRLADFMKGANDSIVILDEDWRIVEANDRALECYGYSLEEMRQMRAMDFRVPEDRSNFPQMVQKLEVDQHLVLEAVHLRKDGTAFPVEISTRLLEVAGSIYRIAIIRDITERKRAEDALREMVHRNEAILSSVPDIIMEVDAKKIYTWANPAGYEFFGPDVIGKEAAYYFEGDQETYRIVQPLFNGDTRLFYVESWQRRKDGRKRLLAWWCKALIDSQGKSIGALSTARDITEIQQAEEKLKTALEEKTVLLREVHHRVKNNLQAIISLMHMRAARLSDLEVQQFLIELEQQARSMLLVYEQVYQSENLAQVQMQPYLDLLTTHIIQAFGLDRSIRLQVNAQDVLLNIDQAMPCGLIINELVTNALKHAFPPEFREPPSLYVAMRHAGSEYVLTVADNGIGLPAGFDWSTLQSMGLQLVRMWVEHQMGGTFRVDAAEGTAYTITFSHGDS